MPSPKRWFPVSRDLNDDHETWEMTTAFGDRALRTWLEILAQLDAHQNAWKVSLAAFPRFAQKVGQRLGTVQETVSWLLARGWLTASQPLIGEHVVTISSPNYWKYHRPREPQRSQVGSPLIRSDPNRTDPSSSVPNLSPLTPTSVVVETSKKKMSGKAADSLPAGHGSGRDRPPAKTTAIWDAYAQAFERRWHTTPSRNAKVNGQLASLLARLGREEAPQVAAFYVSHNDPLYVRKRHQVDFLLRDAEALRTQWATGVKATGLEARSAEQRDAAQEQVKRVRAQLEGGQHGSS